MNTNASGLLPTKKADLRGHQPAANVNIRDLIKHSYAPKLLSNTEKCEHVKHQTARWLAMEIIPLTTVKSKHYLYNIESIDSTMKPFSTITMKENLRYFKYNIWDVIFQRVAGLWMSHTTYYWKSLGNDYYTVIMAQLWPN